MTRVIKYINIIATIPMLIVAIIFSSQVSFGIPWMESAAPATLQTLVLSLIVYFFPKKEVYLAILLFILLGVLGLPVFADGACCMETMTGNSGGYIYGFFLAALILKSFFDQLKSSNSGKLLYILLYTLIVLLFGFIHLSFRIGMNSAFAYGILPFLPGAVAKILIAWSIIAIFESILSPKP